MLTSVVGIGVQRADVPTELTNNASTIDTSTWGTPSAAFPVTPQCNVTQYFTPQQLVLDIALCGDWSVPPLLPSFSFPCSFY